MTIEKIGNKSRLNRVFLWTGKAIHYIDPLEPQLPGVVPERARSLCGVTPMWPGFWCSDDVEIEAERMAKLSQCKVCEQVAGSYLNG